MRVCVTGGSGFIGQAVLKQISTDCCFELLATTQSLPRLKIAGVKYVETGDLAKANFASIFSFGAIDAIVHTAARVHAMADVGSTGSILEYRRINTECTLKLAEYAASAGVKRFIFLSSVKVNGETTPLGRPFTEADEPSPSDAYSVSKHEAEVGLKKISDQTGMMVTCIRPSLVYGPGVRANFLTLVRCVASGWPLPIKCINNKRSLVSLPNLVDLVIKCLVQPHGTYELFLASDGEDVSTPELARRIGYALGRKNVRMFCVPQKLLSSTAFLLKKGEQAQRILGSLQVDSTRARALLGWRPPLSLDDGLRLVAESYWAGYRVKLRCP